MNPIFLQSARGQKLERRYLALKEELLGMGWLTHGSVTPNHPGHWRWTTKVKSKTVTLSLSQEQADLFKVAIANHRRLESIVRKMRAISQEVLLQPNPRIRKKSALKNVPKPS